MQTGGQTDRYFYFSYGQDKAKVIFLIIGSIICEKPGLAESLKMAYFKVAFHVMLLPRFVPLTSCCCNMALL